MVPEISSLQTVTPVLHFSGGSFLNSCSFQAALGITPQMNNTRFSLSCLQQTLADKQLA